MKNQTIIIFENVTLTYELHHDKTNNLKEYVVNLFRKRNYIEKKKSTLNAVDNLSLAIAEGERVGIIGLNGSGKSTTLKIISGILKPTKGKVFVNGAVQPLIEIGAGFDPEFTGRENIFLNGYMLGFSKAEIRKMEDEIIEFSGLREFIDVPIKYYSSGMSVRLAFTIATSIRPDILIIDEMLAAGDAEFAEKARRRISDLVTTARALVIVSHDMSIIKGICNRVIYMKAGRVVFDGDPSEAIESYFSSIDVGAN